jgi:hypothetical protein
MSLNTDTLSYYLNKNHNTMNKTYNVDEQFIKEAYASASEETKQRLLKQFPDVFKTPYIEIDYTKTIGLRSQIENNNGNPFFVGHGVIGEDLRAEVQGRCIVPCVGYTVKLIPNTGLDAKIFPTLIVFERTKD